MDKSIYLALKEKALASAKKAGMPSFYALFKNELDTSLSIFSSNEIVQKCRSYLDDSRLHPAHGIRHCETVAVEAGALVRIECQANNMPEPSVDAIILCSQLAGLLHDIKRMEENHTIAGSIEAEKILNDFDLDDRYRRYITSAIRNHEAFKQVLESEDESAKLISDSLYDADKFRWGPDNFTITLWLIMESSETPLKKLYDIFQEKMEGIKKIKGTFRTKTGRTYGPEFIDLGIYIGNEVYKEIHLIVKES
jgi:hypothetical protein